MYHRSLFALVQAGKASGQIAKMNSIQTGPKEGEYLKVSKS